VLAGAATALGPGDASYVLSETDFRREGAHTNLSVLRDVLESSGFRVAAFYGGIWDDVLFVREGVTPAPVFDAGRRRIPVGTAARCLSTAPASTDEPDGAEGQLSHRARSPQTGRMRTCWLARCRSPDPSMALP
jgi:hypothetical protein